MGLDEMTGSPNLTIVPDPSTFRVLPWAPGIGWVLCDEYFNSGVPFHFSPRHLLRQQLQRLANKGMRLLVGLEIEWYLLRVAQDASRRRQYRLSRHARAADQNGAAGAGLFLPLRIQHGLDAAGALRARRSFREDRTAAALDRERVGTGAARVHLRRAAGAGSRRPCAAVPHRDAANLPPHGIFRHVHVPAGAQGLLLQRLAPASVAGRRAGADATCSCRSASATVCRRSAALSRRVDADMPPPRPPLPRRRSTATGDFGRTRLRPTAPHGATTTAASWSACWARRTIRRRGWRTGSASPPPTLIFILLSQIVAGLDGVEQGHDPGPPQDEPYNAELPMLPTNLPAALDALEREPLFRAQLGDVFIDYFLKLKRNEAGRFAQWLKESGVAGSRRADGVGAERVFRFFLMWRAAVQRHPRWRRSDCSWCPSQG